MVIAVATDWRKAPLTPADTVMLEFGEKLTRQPSAMAESDVEALRHVGFADRDIVAITAAAAYRNFIIRVADGLGVELGATGSGYYDPEVLRAFGVTDRAVGGTLYADRQRRPAAAVVCARRPTVGAAPARTGDGRPCWMAAATHDLPDATLAAQATPGKALETPRNLAAALVLKPQTLAATLDFAKLVDGGRSPLGARLEAIVGVVVAAVLGLRYLEAHHGRRLLDAGATSVELGALVDDPGGGSLAGREREAARFAEVLTRAPGTMARADVEVLRAAGFDDRDIVTIVGAVAFANYRGRIAAALGVQLDDG